MKVALRLLLVGLCAGGVWLACDTTNVHIFIAGQYIRAMDCVTPGEAVDVQDGPAVDASCDATCVVPPYADGAVYITGACAPFPPGDLVNPEEAGLKELCLRGLAAIHRSDLCLEGGPSNPVDSSAPIPLDSGVDSGASPADGGAD
jgi:hypothetical protein